MFRSKYLVKSVDNDKIEIVDLNGDKSVTNDAENVVKELVQEHGNKRIFYIDSEGCRDELLHVNGQFAGFKSARQ